MGYKIKKILDASISSVILLFAIILNLIAFLSRNIYTFYSSSSFVGNIITLLLIIAIQRKISKKEQLLIIYFLILFVYALLSFIILDGGLAGAIIATYSILIFWVYKRCKFNSGIFKLLILCFMCLNLFWVISSPGYFAKYSNNVNKYLNSNLVGAIIMYTAIYISIFIRNSKWVVAKLTLPILYLLSFWGLLNCQARGSFITLLIFIIFDVIVPKKVWRNKRIAIGIMLMIIIAGTLFPYIYTKMYSQYSNSVTPFIKKPLYTGREEIWHDFFTVTSGKGLSNFLFPMSSLWPKPLLELHNAYLAIIADFGVIGFILFYGFWVKQVTNLYKRNEISDFRISLLLGFLVLLINAYIEPSILRYTMSFFSYMSLGLALNDNDIET